MHDLTGAAPALAVTRVRARAGRRTLLTEVSLRLDRGTTLGLLGPNGSGKTTLMRVLAGLIRPTAGEVRIFGADVSAGAPILTRVGFSIGRPALLPQHTGWANLRFAADQRAGSDPVDLAAPIRLADLGAALHRRTADYSAGMRQRLALAIATIAEPDLLVLDEPTSALDPAQADRVCEFLEGYIDRGGSVLLASHTLAEIERLCARVIVMVDGQILADRSAVEVASAGGMSRFYLNAVRAHRAAAA